MGRLIDEDFVKRRMHETMDYQDLYLPVHFEMCMRDAPTIAAPRWVRCEDAKPKERDYYFAFTADAEAFVGEYIPSVDQWWNGDDLILTVTHWMPIEPPKEDA